MKSSMIMASLVLAAAAGAAQAGQVRVWGDVNDSNQMAGETGQFRAGSGGEFKIQVISGSAGVTNRFSDNIGQTAGGTTFQTFCLERDEYVWNPNNTYGFLSPLTDVAQLGGNNTNNGDQISNETAWLYTQFRNGALSGYTYATGTGREGSANQLQHAIWALEQELGGDGSQAAVIAALGTNAQAITWVNDAFTATAGGWTNTAVRALNIFVDTDGDGIQDQGEVFAQSQLTLIPLPTGAALGLAGLSVLAIRRRAAR
jgi:hypothetical protein